MSRIWHETVGPNQASRPKGKGSLAVKKCGRQIGGDRVRFLHTADLQIGMHAAFASEDCAAKIRAARLRTLKRIVQTANDQNVDFMIIAGDLFEDVGPALADIGAVTGELRNARMPAYVLPGNHDPAAGASPYSAASWKELERETGCHSARADEIRCLWRRDSTFAVSLEIQCRRSNAAF